MIPALDVGHIASATSFYQAILDSLRLRYLSADKDPNCPSTTSVVFGGSRSPAAIFQLQKEADPKISHVTLSAPTPEAVIQFHQAALRANPDLASGSSSVQFLRRPINPSGSGAETETRARVTDLFGNRMEVVYMPPPGYPKNYSGSTVRKTECTTDEVSRILEWNYNIASSDKQSVVSSHSSSSGLAYGDVPPPYALKRSATTSTVEPIRSGSLATVTKEQASSGWTSTTVLGTVLGTAAGVVAGAALTYSVMKGEPKKAPDVQPQFSRRATFPENHGALQDNTKQLGPPSARLALEAPPPRSITSTLSKRGLDDMGRIVGGMANDYIQDSRSRVSRYPPSTASSRTIKSRGRSSSESGGSRTPLLLTETEHRSVYAPSAAPSRVPVSGKAPSIAPSGVSRHTSATRYEREYTRAPTAYEESGGRPLMANLPLEGRAPAPSIAPSRMSRHTSASRHSPENRDDGRPLMANLPLDGMTPAPSIAPSRMSRHTSASRHSPENRDDDRPLMANLPLDGMTQAPSVAPSRTSRHTSANRSDGEYARDSKKRDNGRPLMANLPLDGMASAPSVVPSYMNRHTSANRRDTEYGADSNSWENDRPLVANLPVDGSDAEYLPPRSVTTRSSFSRSKPFDDFEVIAQDPDYVLDGRESQVSTRLRNTAATNHPPATGMSTVGSRSRGPERAYEFNQGAVGRSRLGAPSQASARQVPLPQSAVGWDGGDNDSVAPEDSISCVMSRR